ncbi:hypothetical protein RND81_01G161100 [Saponaria officinalis]|uniref:Fe2OG dioxygenase domain-containing protein n=1 Tax=Saponaria officinalis TaxID=3572 RepID=A0AAW1NFW4_SAPOF
MASYSYDLSRDDFESTKLGVKGLTDSRVKFIPDIFYHSDVSVINLNEFDTVTTIPTVDLAEPHHNVVRKIWDASSSLGAFQIVNHNIPKSHIDGIIQGIKNFHELHPNDKMWWYGRDSSLNYDKGVYFYSNIDLFYSRAVSWQDMIQIRLSPLPVSIPDVCKNEVTQWSAETRQIAERLMGYLSEGLGLPDNKLKGDGYLGRGGLLGYYYPYCPEAVKTFAEAEHSDPGVITILVHDEDAAFQVKNGRKWLYANTRPGALLIIIGDLLQIISNGQYKSGEHRVLANGHKQARSSVAVVYSSGYPENIYGPLPELVSATNPALYRAFRFSDYTNKFFRSETACKVMANYYQI